MKPAKDSPEERPSRPLRGRETVSAPDFWERLYAEGRTPWDLNAAAPPLLRACSQLLAGEAPVALAEARQAGTAPAAPRGVFLGAGHGHDALAYAASGFDVTGIDFSPRAVEAASARARDSGVDARFEVHDIFDLPRAVSQPFELLVEHTCFCAIHPERRDEYVDVARAVLGEAGVFVGLFFPVDPDWHGGPPYQVSVAEIERRFSRAFEIVHVETPSDSVPERAGIERLVWMRVRRGPGDAA